MRRIRPGAHCETGMTMALVAGDTRLAWVIADDRGLVFDPSLVEVDATFTFDDVGTAFRVLTGAEDPMTAFLDGRFRSDAHLPLAFVLGLFGPATDTTVPP